MGKLQGEWSSGSGRWAGVVWSVGLLVFYRPLEVTFVFSVVSSISEHCRPALSHCLSDQTHKWAERLHWPAFSQTGVIPSHSTFLSNKVSDLCSHMDVLESSLIYLHDCMWERVWFSLFYGRQTGHELTCSLCVLSYSARRNDCVLKLFKSYEEGGLSLCFALCLEDLRANRCSHLTAENFAFAHFV